MRNYIHDVPTKLYFGKGQICHLEEELNDEKMKNDILKQQNDTLERR